MRTVEDIELLNVEKLIKHFEDWFTPETITLEQLNEIRQNFWRIPMDQLLEVKSLSNERFSSKICEYVNEQWPLFNKAFSINVDVGIPGMCLGEFNSWDDFYKLCAAYVIKERYVEAAVSGSCDYILYLADEHELEDEDAPIEYNSNLEPIIRTEKQANRYEELANAFVYGPSFPLVGPEAPVEISDWLLKNKFEEHHLFLISATVIPFRFMAGVAKYWKTRVEN